MDFTAKLRDKFVEYGYGLSDVAAEKFLGYYRFLVGYNGKVNLTAITDEDGVIAKHFLDSLAATPYLKEGVKLADIGSGAGFPAVVLKIYRPDADVTMFESNGKKTAFLEALTEELGLKGIRAANMRAEDAGRKERYREAFDVVTARAVTETRVLLEYAMPLLKMGGRLVAYKAHCADEVAAAENAAKILGAELTEAKEYALEGNFRTLLVYTKTAETPEKYPRRYARIASEPL